MDLTGKAAFVTGGSGDIGSAIAGALAAAGADVAVSLSAVPTVRKRRSMRCKRLERRGLAVQLDQREAASIDAAVGAVVKHFGRVDILVNNAAWNIGIRFPDLEALTEQSGIVCTKPICAVRSCSHALSRLTSACTRPDTS
jgi:3-oxoacyl-[acyl-carrier protein] reductase